MQTTDIANNETMTLTVNIDAQMFKEIKQAIMTLRGVLSVDKSERTKSYERARADIENGRIVECENKEDFFKKLGF